MLHPSQNVFGGRLGFQDLPFSVYVPKTWQEARVHGPLVRGDIRAEMFWTSFRQKKVALVAHLGLGQIYELFDPGRRVCTWCCAMFIH